MKKIYVIKRSETKCTDAHHEAISTPQQIAYSWKMFISFFQGTALNMLGFSEREINVVHVTNNAIFFKCDPSLITGFTLSLAEASSIDYEFHSLKPIVTEMYIRINMG